MEVHLMGLFKPLYLDRDLSCDKREKALEKEKNLRRLRKFALDQNAHAHLRGVAIIRANDAELCEAVLMELASYVPNRRVWSSELEPYEQAVHVLSELGEQERLEKIFVSCVNYEIQGAIISHISNPETLREYVLGKKGDGHLRGVAMIRLNDPDLCEAVLMERASDAPVKEPLADDREVYEKAAQFLSDRGEQERLEKIFASCMSRIIQAIIISVIENEDLLLKVAIDEKEEYFYPAIGYSGPNAPYEAVGQINNNDKLALIALQATNIRTSIQAVAKINSQKLLGEILKKSLHIRIKREALRRISDVRKYADPIRNEMIPGIIDAPLGSDDEIGLLAMTGDKTGRALLWLVNGDGSNGRDNKIPLDIQPEILEADADILIAAIKNIIKELSNDPSRSGIHGLFKRTAACIGLLHENGIKRERIEKEVPKSLTYHYDYYVHDICYEADLFEVGHYTGDETVTFW